jgi:hypothetical protein
LRAAVENVLDERWTAMVGSWLSSTQSPTPGSCLASVDVASGRQCTGPHRLRSRIISARCSAAMRAGMSCGVFSRSIGRKKYRFQPSSDKGTMVSYSILSLKKAQFD